MKFSQQLGLLFGIVWEKPIDINVIGCDWYIFFFTFICHRLEPKSIWDTKIFVLLLVFEW